MQQHQKNIKLPTCELELNSPKKTIVIWPHYLLLLFLNRLVTNWSLSIFECHSKYGQLLMGKNKRVISQLIPSTPGGNIPFSHTLYTPLYQISKICNTKPRKLAHQISYPKKKKQKLHKLKIGQLASSPFISHHTIWITQEMAMINFLAAE